MASFKDGHCHPLFAGRELLGPNITACQSLDEIRNVLTNFAAANPDLKWIDASAYARDIALGCTSIDLDGITDRPIVLHADDHHTLWVSTAALAETGLLDAIPELSVGRIDVDVDGKPTGILREWDAMRLVLDHIPPLTIEQEISALSAAQELLLSLGITEVQDAWIDPGMTEIYVEFARRGLLKMRVDLALRFDPQTWKKDYSYFADCIAMVQELGNPKLQVNAAKFFADGVLGSATAALSEPYASDACNFGELVWEPGNLAAAFSKAVSLGLSPHIHAIGDAAISASLDLIETFQAQLRSLQQRPVIAHCELIDEQDLERFSELDVTANLQPLWARKDGLLTSCIHHIGGARLDRMYPMRSLLENRAKLTFGSDWPVSNPNPLLGAYTAVYRSVGLGPGWNEAEAISIDEALAAYTDAEKDQDFIVLSGNPHEASREQLLELKVLETYVAGELVWQFG